MKAAVVVLVAVLAAVVLARSIPLRKPGCFSTCFRQALKAGNSSVISPCYVKCYDRVARNKTKDDTAKMLKIIPEARDILIKAGIIQQKVAKLESNVTVKSDDVEEMSDALAANPAPGATLEATDGLNIRGQACTGGRIITAVVAGTRMTYTNQAINACGYVWYSVRGSFGDGWAASNFLREVQAGGFPLYKQCDGRWANDRLGSSTVCRIGCLMSSVSMALAGRGKIVDGQQSNPGVLNRFLSRNGGYQGDLFIWGSVARFGFGYIGQTRDKNQIHAYLNQNKIVILNVRNGGHWVLATGHNNGGFYVNDSGFQNTYYSNAEVVLAGVYNG